MPRGSCRDDPVDPDQRRDLRVHEAIPVRKYEVQGQKDQGHE